MRTSPLALCLTLALVPSCTGTGHPTQPDATIYGEQCQPGGTFDINGRAAVLAELNVHVNASGLVEVDTTAELLIAMDAVQTGVEVAVVAEPCAIEIPDVPIAGQDQPIQFDVPAATIASVEQVTGSAALSSPNQTCARFESDRFTIAIGAILDPIETAVLPNADANGDFPYCAPTADTPCHLAIGVNCACDQESDGKPGATLLASNVPAVQLDQVYATMRTRFSLDGEVFSSDLILGEIDATIEQGILGCRLANGNPCNADQVGAIKNLNPVITQQPGNPSTYRAVRVDEGATCADILARRDELFPR
jgi:hypothetical protein